jgi:hypothetical protein
MLTEETIQNIKSTIDTTLMELFDITQKQLRSFEDSDINPYSYSMFDYKINVPDHKPQFFSVMLKNHPIEGARYLIITTTDHKFEDGTWMIHNPSNVINTTDIKESSEGEVSPQFYETLANQLGLAYFAKQVVESKILPIGGPHTKDFYTEIEPLNTNIPLNETKLQLLVRDDEDKPVSKLTVPSAVWLERDGYTKNNYPIEHYVYDTNQEQFRLYAQHIGDPTATEVERRPTDTQFYQNLQLHRTPSLRFPFHSPSEFATQASKALWAPETPTSTTHLDNNQFKKTVELFNSSKVSGNTNLSEPESKQLDEPSL